jgi:hypothetical protein
VRGRQPHTGCCSGHEGHLVTEIQRVVHDLCLLSFANGVTHSAKAILSQVCWRNSKLFRVRPHKPGSH